MRTAWIFGPDGNNFPQRIIAAAKHAMASGTSLRVVVDEFGNPTWAPDLAARIGEAISMGTTGMLHLAGTPPASRFDWAAEILAGVAVHLERITSAEFQRVSRPPPNATLSMARAAEIGIPPMDWRPTSEAYVRMLLAEEVA